MVHSIQCLKTKKFVYGTAFAPGLSEKTYLGWRNLAGNRTIYEKVKNFYPERFSGEYVNFISDVTTVISSKKIVGLIDNGLSKKQFTDDEFDLYLEGVSTIGNTLPSDIVEALSDFTSDDPNFVKEPWYEFYIPATEIMACPVAEESENCYNGGGAAYSIVTCCSPYDDVICTKNNNTKASISSSESDED